MRPDSPEPKGELDAMTAFAFEVAIAALGVDVEVNPTKDEVHPWEAINWRLQEDNVRRLRQRIFTGLA